MPIDSARRRSRLPGRLPLGSIGLLALALLLTSPAGAGVVETGRAQCCSSIVPELPPATYYGATMRRDDDPRSRWHPYLHPPAAPPAPIDVLLRRIDDLEGNGGPMNPDLSLALEGLGAAYLAENRYREAVQALRPGIHLARVNEGLHTPSQVRMLEQLILAHLRQGDYASADEQQAYLFRVRRWRHSVDEDVVLEATKRYADWLRGAYLADVDDERYPRLVGLSDLYEDAIESLEELQGADSTALLPYLQGRVELSYLISVYPGEQDGGFQADARQPLDFAATSDAQIRFWRLRDHNFRYGLQALQRKESILATGEDQRPDARADAILAIGDWYQWHRRYAEAIRTYKEAWRYTEGIPGGRDWQVKHLGRPLELPKETVFNPGLVPLDTPNSATISVRFDVNRHGEAKDIAFLTPESEENRIAITRAYHYLRNVRFRPRVSEGSVVRTEGLERTYDIRF